MDAHGTGLLPTLVISLVFAFAGGVLAKTLRLPPIAGYLLAGVLVGPFTPGFVADQKVATELAEIGVALLLFGVGLHFSPEDLWRVRRIAVPGALAQIAIAILAGFLCGRLLLGLSEAGALILGLSLAIASTAAATRALADRGRLETPAGRIALGWLVVQDVVVILALLLVPLLAGAGGTPGEIAGQIGAAVLQILGFVLVMAVVGRRVIPWLLGHVARLGSRELFTLAVIAMALGIAAASTVLFGVSAALGAFVAGVVLGESDLNHQAAADALPMQQVFTVLFFVSIGMLFDPSTVLRMPLEVVAVLITIVIGTGLATFALLILLRASVETAVLVGAAFAQIGEFSFILTELAVGRGLIGTAVRDLVLAAALIAIVINAPLFRLFGMLGARLAPSRRLRRWRDGAPERAPEPVRLRDHAIVVGYGRVGRMVAAALEAHELPYVILEADRQASERARAAGARVIYGDATHPDILAAAAAGTARLLVVALPDAYHARHVIALARRLNPRIETVVRTHSDQEARYLDKEAGVGLVVMGEREVALGMSDFAMQCLGVESERAQRTINDLRTAARAGEA